MPYLGNKPAVAYTSTTKDTFSGDASTTDFTMSKSANVNAVRVVVENVVQDPGVAYTCSGTTLSFTSAPPTGTNNIYVVHLGPPAATVAPPTTINNATTFTGGVTFKNESPEDTDGGRESILTFKGVQSGEEESTLAQIQASHHGTSDDQKGDLIFKTNDGSNGASPSEAMRISNNGGVSIGTATPNIYANYHVLTMNGTNGGVLDLESNGTLTGEIYVGTNQLFVDAVGSSSSLKLQTNSQNALLIDENGHINKPKQSCFFAKKSAVQNNIATDTLVTVAFNSEIFDQNSDYNSSTSTFTAPVTGRYLITCHILLEAVDTVADYYQLRLTTSNRIHYCTKEWGGYSSDPSYGVLDVIVICDMDANDTLFAGIYQQGGSVQTDLNSTTCTFSACLLA